MRVKTKTTLMRAFTFLLLFVTTVSTALALAPVVTVSAQDPAICTNQNDTYDAALNKCTQPAAVDPMSGIPLCLPPYEGINGGFTCAKNPDNPPQVLTCPAPYTNQGGNCRAAPTAGNQCPNGGQYVDPRLPGQPVTEQPYCSVQGTRAPAGQAGPPTAAEEPDNCPIAQNQELRWAYCPLFNGIGLLTNTIDSFINEYLTTGNKIFDDSDTGTVNGAPVTNGYKNAWQTFRNFGIALVVIAGLVMLVSEAFGLEFIDAYTVRRVLPRLLIAILGISLSWELCKFLVTFFDTLGRAAGSIIYTAFNIGDAGIPVWPSIMAYLIGGGTVLYGALLLGGFGLLSMLGTLILAMVIGAAVLILRQAIIIAAVIMAPLAIAAYILPNTNKLASFWWDTFIKMLMLYPIATGLIALCKVMGKIAMGNPGGTGERTAMGDLIAVISGIIFFFAGYALIPVAFRLTGGLVATIGGIANDRSKGGFDRLKNYRAGKKEHNAAALKTGTRFQDNNPFARTFNRTSAGLGTGVKGRFGMGRRGSQALDQMRRNTAADSMKSPAFQAIANDDDALRAATYRSASEARAGMSNRLRQQLANGDISPDSYREGMADINRAVAAAQTSTGFSRSGAIAAAQQMATTGTGYTNLQDMTETIARASGGNRSTASSIAGFANSETKARGRHDMAPGFGTLNGLVQDTISGGGRTPSRQAFEDATVAAGRGVDNATLMKNKTASVSNIAKANAASLQRAQNVINDPTATAEQRATAVQTAADITAKLDNMRDSGVYGSEANVVSVNVGGTQAARPNMELSRDRMTPGYETQQKVVDPATGKETIVKINNPNANFDQTAAERYSSQRRGNRSSDPNDPRNEA